MAGDILMRKILHRFNMVEIVLAMGVVAFGVTAVMALLPPSLNANRDVSSDAFAEEAISKVVALVNFDYAGMNIPNSKPSTATIENLGESTTDYNNNIKDWNIFKYSSNGVYMLSNSDSSLQVQALVWQEQVSDLFLGEIDNYVSIPNANAVRIFVETSWPINAKYENRQKRLEVIDFFN